MKNAFTLALIALPLLIGAPSASAQRATDAPPLVVAADNRTASADVARGVARTDKSVHPGDVLHYRLTFTNLAGRPVRKVELRNPVAAGMQLVAGSVHASRGDARVEYSADHGQSYAAQPMETVVVDGRSVQQPISPARYTDVRWVVDGTLDPQAVVTAEFEARFATNTPEASTQAPAHGASGR